MPFSDLIQMVSNRVALLFISASAAADRFAAALLGRTPARSTLVATKLLLVGAYSSDRRERTVAPNCRMSTLAVFSHSTLTGRGVSYLALLLNVPGMRKTRAASAVTVMSIANPSCLHNRLKFSAMGFQVVTSTASVSGQ
jgi:hypothetical protein